MALCEFAPNAIKEKFINIDNTFFSDFLPDAPCECVKVYFYGHYVCQNNININSIEQFATNIQLPVEQVLDCFYYWQELGLIQMSTNPLRITYNPPTTGSMRLKKYNKDKYKDFIIELTKLIEREITKTEFDEYMWTIESLKIEKSAMLAIVAYCINQKNDNKIGYKYVLKVAKQWAYLGILTYQDVLDRIEQENVHDLKLKDLFTVFGIKRTPSTDEYQTYMSWLNSLEFDYFVIQHVAKIIGKNNNGINILNNKLNKFYSLNIKTAIEIEQYVALEDELYNTAKSVCKNLAFRYSSLETIVDNYISKWFELGYDKKSLEYVATQCFLSNKTNFMQLNQTIENLYTLGVIEYQSIIDHYQEQTNMDKQIQKILTSLTIERQIKASDRVLYKTWTQNWKISNELLDYACQMSFDKYLPLIYLNKILNHYYVSNITTVEQASKDNFKQTNVKETEKKTRKKNFVEREYSSESMNALFDKITEVEI